MRLLTVPGVYDPRSDSRMLAGVLGPKIRPGESALDVFTGSGVIAIRSALAGAGSVEAVDVSRRAVACARLNARLNRVRVRVHHGDLFAPLAGRRFDVITANPPYLPSLEPEREPRGAARAWEGGDRGRRLIERLAAEAPRHLRPGGRLLLVQTEVCGFEATLEALEAAGLRAEVLARMTEPIGPLLRARQAELTARGMLRPGQRNEDMAVIRAHAAEDHETGGSPRPAPAATAVAL